MDELDVERFNGLSEEEGAEAVEFGFEKGGALLGFGELEEVLSFRWIPDCGMTNLELEGFDIAFGKCKFTLSFLRICVSLCM